jgi:hypothetical protein
VGSPCNNKPMMKRCVEDSIMSDVTPCRLVHSSQHFKGSLCLHLQGQVVHDVTPLGLCNSEDEDTMTLRNVTYYSQDEQCHIPQDWHLWQHSCGNLQPSTRCASPKKKVQLSKCAGRKMKTFFFYKMLSPQIKILLSGIFH